MTLDDRIRKVLAEYGQLGTAAETISPTADLYEAGLTSHASVNVMLALEAEFDLELPDQMLSRAVFSSVASIRAALEQVSTH